MSRASHGQPEFGSNAQWYAPLDFISCVQTCMSSWISSGATSLRVQDSCQCGFGGATGWVSALAPFAPREPSLDPKTFLKKGIVQVNSGRAARCLAACVVGGRGGAEGLQ